MRPLFLLPLLVTTAALAAAAASPAQAGGPPRCDGRHRRPANPYGSVLSAGLAPTPVTAPAPAASSPAPASAPGSPSAAAATPAITWRPHALSRAEAQASLRPCGGGRA